MLPLRYDFHYFGGSWAQRQVFSVTMIQAAVKANNLSLTLALVTERRPFVHTMPIIIIDLRLIQHFS